MFWITNKDYQEDIVALPKADDFDYKVGEGLLIDPEDGIAYPLPEAPSPQEAETFYAPQYISAVTLSAGSKDQLLAYKVTQDAEIKVLCGFIDGVPNVGDEIYPINAQICVSGLNTSPTAKGHIIIEDLNGCDDKSTFTFMGQTVPGGEITVRIFPTPSIDIEEGGGADLPEVNSDDNGKVLTVVDGVWDKATAPKELPTVNNTDDGKILKVVDGVWDKSTPTSELPAVTAADNGNILKVVNGAWSKASESSGGTAFDCYCTISGTAVTNRIQAYKAKSGTSTWSSSELTALKNSIESASIIRIHSKSSTRESFYLASSYIVDSDGLPELTFYNFNASDSTWKKYVVYFMTAY